MKAFPDKVIVYDNNCPMCSLYTKGFVEWGLLEKQNRISFDDLDSTAFTCQLDLHRAKHEIPLIDLQNGKTIYGLDALIFIMGNKIPCIKRIFQFKPVYALSACLYNVVSYNRRIIGPANILSGKKDFGPDLSIKHRIFFIGISFLLSCMLIYSFGNSFHHHLNVSQSGLQMMGIVSTGWLIQTVIGLAFLKSKKLDYIGHLSVAFLIGSLVLLPGITINAITSYQYVSIPVVSVIFSNIIMLWQHFIRIRHLQLSQNLTFIWSLIILTTLAFWMYLNQLTL